MGSRVDVGPVMVRGALRARNARVIWDDGTLYVASRRAGRLSVQSVEASEPTPPKTRDGIWKTTTDESQSISFTRRGCGG